MNHSLLGASFPFAIALIWYLIRHCRASFAMLIITPLAMAICGVWASIPDLPRLVGWHSLYMKLSMDPRINIFFWHYTIDQIETDSSWYAAGIFLLGMAVMLAALRELKIRETP
ncbi:MAG: hypothetical protein WCI03_00485 [bacterium]|jgi:hypothetical protein